MTYKYYLHIKQIIVVKKYFIIQTKFNGMILSDEKMTILFCIPCGITFQVCTGQSTTIWWWQDTQSLPLTGILAFGKVDGGTFHFQQIIEI